MSRASKKRELAMKHLYKDKNAREYSKLENALKKWSMDQKNK